jgi:hypothetical protein
MSRDEIESINQSHLKDVRQALEISDKSKFKLNVGTAVAICFFICGGSWKICTYLDKIQSSLQYKWSSGDQSSWASALGEANKTVQRSDGTQGLSVPDPRLIYKDNQESDGKQ